MQSKLKKWFFYWGISMLVIVICFAIFQPAKRINLQDLDFTTTQSSELYFKNMRSYFYDKTVHEAANFKIYRIGSREKDSTKNKLSFMLLSNWLQSECYVMAESGLVDFKKKALKLSYEHPDSSGTLLLSDGASYSHYVFAAKLYEQLNKNASLHLKHSKNWIEFTEGEKKSLKKTLNDYFKLIGKLR